MTVFASAVLSLWSAFATPPESARPWCYWWWVNGHTDRQTITADLESMKRLGFGGILMIDSRGYWENDEHVVNPKAELGWGTEGWYDLVEFSIRECARLGLEFSMNASASGGTLNGFIDGKEYEVDVMNRDEVVAHLDRAVGPLLKRVPDLVGKTFTHIYSVSYEGSVKTGGSWSAIKDNFYATMKDWSHSHGLKVRFFQRAAVLSARREGRRIVSLEAFTHMLRHWSVEPSTLKPLADIAFADGANRLVWHTYSCSPEKFGVPGAEYFAGTHVNRNVPWFPQVHAFLAYLARCQVMLQAGEPVTDIALYAGHTPYQHWGRWRDVPWEGARIAIPRGYNYDILNDETLEKRKGNYPVFVDASGDSVTWPKLPPPDFEGDFNDVIHRRTADGTDIYFVAPAGGTGNGRLTFRVKGKVPEFWNPVTGTRRKVTNAETLPDGRIRIPFRFSRDGSVFVVFRPPQAAAADPAPASDWPKSQKTISLTDARWKIDIGGRAYDRLGDWTKSDVPEIRFFSGTAVYRANFTLPAVEGDRTLFLGRVAGGLAEVRVNGVDCGVAWCYPYRVRVPVAAQREGNNVLEARGQHVAQPPDRRLPPAARATSYAELPRLQAGSAQQRRGLLELRQARQRLFRKRRAHPLRALRPRRNALTKRG